MTTQRLMDSVSAASASATTTQHRQEVTCSEPRPLEHVSCRGVIYTNAYTEYDHLVCLQRQFKLISNANCRSVWRIACRTDTWHMHPDDMSGRRWLNWGVVVPTGAVAASGRCEHTARRLSPSAARLGVRHACVRRCMRICVTVHRRSPQGLSLIEAGPVTPWIRMPRIVRHARASTRGVHTSKRTWAACSAAIREGLLGPICRIGQHFRALNLFFVDPELGVLK